MQENLPVRERVIDAYRGLAIALMMLQHSWKYFVKDLMTLEYALIILISRLSMPMFLLIAGFCVSMKYDNKVASVGRKAYLKYLGIRLSGLFIFGLLVNLSRHIANLGPFAFSLGNYLNPSALQQFAYINVIPMIGLSILMCALIRLSGSDKPAIILFALLFLFGMIPHEPAVYVRTDYIQGLLQWIFLTGEYAFGHWSIYAVSGLIIQRIRRSPPSGGFWVLGPAYALIFSAILLISAGFSSDMLSNGVSFMAFVFGFMAIFYHLVHYLSKNAGEIPPMRFLSAYGRHSLSIYVIHSFLFISLPSVAGYSNSVESHDALLIYAGFLALAYALIKKLESMKGIHIRYV